MGHCYKSQEREVSVDGWVNKTSEGILIILFYCLLYFDLLFFYCIFFFCEVTLSCHYIVTVCHKYK